MPTPIDMTAYSAQRILDGERQVVNGAPVNAIPLSPSRLALPRRPGLDLSSLNLPPAGGDDDDGPSPLDVPAFLRRQEG